MQSDLADEQQKLQAFQKKKTRQAATLSSEVYDDVQVRRGLFQHSTL